MSRAHFDVAQVCVNGHMVNDQFQSRREFSKDFCSVCGAKTITKCPACDHAIQGAVHSTRLLGGSEWLGTPPTESTRTIHAPVRNYCHACGKPYPWTTARIEAAKAVAQELDGLSDAERIALQASIDDLAADTPRTEVAVVRFKKLATKAGKHGVEALKNLLVNVASEAVNRQLWR